MIDCYPGLTNEVAGAGSFERGSATVQQIEMQYAAPVMEPVEGDKLLYIKTKANHVATVGLYEAVRSSWKINVSRAEEADYVIAVVDKVCKGVFKVDAWKPTPDGKRSYFDGHEAPTKVTERYVDKRIPPEYTKKGAATPFYFGWK